MSSISEIVDVQISIEDTAVSQAGFGVGLVVGTSSALSSKTQVFSSAEAAAEVYGVSDPELIMIQKYFGQEVRPQSVVAAKRDADVAPETNVYIPTLANSTLYSVAISVDQGDGPVSYGTASYTSDGSATREEIVDGLIAAIALLGAPVTTQDNVEDFDVVGTVAGDPITLTLSANLAQNVVTAVKNIATELALIQQSNDDWYCLLSSSHADKDIKRAAAFIQARSKIYIASSQNADIINIEFHQFTITFSADFVTGNTINLTIDGIPVAATPFDTDQATTIADLAANIALHPKVATCTVTGPRQVTVTASVADDFLTVTALAVTGGASQAVGTVATLVDPTKNIGSELTALAYDRTALIYLSAANAQYPEAAWAGLMLPEEPGSATWYGKELAGVTVDDLTDAQKTKALTNKVNVYTEIGGLGFIQNGTMVSGRFIDIRIGVDWMVSRLEVEIFSLIAGAKKIPYTDAGVALVEDRIRFVLNEAIANEVVAADPEPVINVPAVLSVSSTDRANRLLPDVTFSARLAGAIHEVEVRGTVSV